MVYARITRITRITRIKQHLRAIRAIRAYIAYIAYISRVQKIELFTLIRMTISRVAQSALLDPTSLAESSELGQKHTADIFIYSVWK